MTLFSKLKGTLESLFYVGGNGGVALKANSGALDARNSADSAFIQVRVATTPVGANDAVSKTYADSLVGGGGITNAQSIINAIIFG
jgi:hypothetical protein